MQCNLPSVTAPAKSLQPLRALKKKSKPDKHIQNPGGENGGKIGILNPAGEKWKIQIPDCVK